MLSARPGKKIKNNTWYENRKRYSRRYNVETKLLRRYAVLLVNSRGTLASRAAAGKMKIVQSLSPLRMLNCFAHVVPAACPGSAPGPGTTPRPGPPRRSLCYSLALPTSSGRRLVTGGLERKRKHKKRYVQGNTSMVMSDMHWYKYNHTYLPSYDMIALYSIPGMPGIVYIVLYAVRPSFVTGGGRYSAHATGSSTASSTDSSKHIPSTHLRHRQLTLVRLLFTQQLPHRVPAVNTPPSAITRSPLG